MFTANFTKRVQQEMRESEADDRAGAGNVDTPTNSGRDRIGSRNQGARKRPKAKNEASPASVSLAGLVKSAITYFPAEQYHRLQRLNFCVRDGNRCDPLHMVTDKS
jgi:hypothetical protein